MVNANWRKLAQDVKLHKTVSQWQAIVRTSQPGSKRTGRRPREEIHSERERERQIGRTACQSKEKGEQRSEGMENCGESGLERQDSTKGYGAEEARGNWRIGRGGVEEREEIVRHVTSCILPGRWNSRQTLSCTVARTPCPFCSFRCMYARGRASTPGLLLASPSHEPVFRKPPPRGQRGRRTDATPVQHGSPSSVKWRFLRRRQLYLD